MKEAEPVRAAFFEVDGQVFQRTVDHQDVELAFYDLSDSPHPMQEARELAAAIQRTPMPLTGPLFKFALFQTQSDEFCFFGCCHHIVLDGSGIALVGHRIASVYSAVVSGAPIPTALFGSLADLIECESEYEASNDYLEDQAYWTTNLAQEIEPHQSDHRKQQTRATRIGLLRRCNSTQLFFAGLRTCPKHGTSLDRRCSPRRAHSWCVDGTARARRWSSTSRSPVACSPSRRRIPGMVAGVVPLVLKASPEASVASFCEHVDTQIREALRHQRFPVHAIERKIHSREPGELANRVNVNFLPSTFTLDFGGCGQRRRRWSMWASSAALG